MPTPRKGDPVQRWEALHNGYGAVFAVMTGHAAYRWHLISAADRIAVRRSITLNDRRPIHNADGTHTAHERFAVKQGPSERIWRGHASIVRPTPANGVKSPDTGKRARVKIARRTVEHVTAATIGALTARFATVNAGERVTWSVGALEGTFTRAADDRMTMGGDAVARSVRTMDAITRKLELAAT